jgi:tetratricopeptide (TPR) repeat protein
MNKLEKAIHYWENGLLKRSREFLKHWLNENPYDLYAHMLLMKSYFDDKKFDEIKKGNKFESFYYDGYEADNRQMIAGFLNGEKLLRKGLNKEAVNQIRKLLEEGPVHPVLHYKLGQALEKNRDENAAQKEYRKTLKQEPSFLPAIFSSAVLYFRMGRFDKSLGLINKIPSGLKQQLKRQFMDSHITLAKLTEIKKSIQIIRKSVQLKNKNKIYDAAYTLWPVFRKHNDNYTVIRIMAFLFYLMINGFKTGEVRFKEVMTAESPTSFYAFGLMYWYMDDLKESLQCYDRALDKEPGHPVILCSRALLYLALKRYEEGIRDFGIAFQMQPWLVQAREELASYAFYKEDYPAVLRFVKIPASGRRFALLYDIDGENRVNQLDILRLKSLLKMGKTTEALKQVKKDTKPFNNGKLMYYRAMVRAANKEYLTAGEELARSIELDYQLIGLSEDKDLNYVDQILENASPTPLLELINALKPAFKKDLNEAANRVGALLKKFPDNLTIRYHCANIAFMMRDIKFSRSLLLPQLGKGKYSAEILGLYCMILKEEEGLTQLLQLGEKLKTKTLPYKYAFDLALARGHIDKAVEIGKTILKKNPGDMDVLVEIVRLVKKENLETALLFQNFTRQNPLVFEVRKFNAYQFAKLGKFKESKKKIFSLLNDGYGNLDSVLLYGLSCLGTRVPG